MITYTGYSAVKRGSVGGLKSYSYVAANAHICFVKGDKRLKFVSNILSLSLNNGVSYDITLDLTGVCDIVQYSKILDNGVIGWAGQTKFYYSTDNLATYHESTVLNIAGTAYVPNTYNNFKGLSHHRKLTIPSGKELVCWANYSTDAADNSNVWYTIDDFVTIKSAFAKGVSLEAIDYRHIDSINYCAIDDSWWITTGDSGYCKWIKGIYTPSTDSWAWEIINEGDEWHMTGLSFDDTYCYLGSDTVGLPTYFGVWRIPYSNMSTAKESWTMILDLNIIFGCYTDFGNGLVIASEGGVHRFSFSYDYGATWDSPHTLTGGPDITTPITGWYFCPVGPTTDNKYTVQIQESYSVELDRDSPSGITLLLQIIRTYGS